MICGRNTATKQDLHRLQLKRKRKREKRDFSSVIYNLIWSHNVGICLIVISFYPQTQAKARVEFLFNVLKSEFYN